MRLSNGARCFVLYSRLPYIWGDMDSNHGGTIALRVRDRQNAADRYTMVVKNDPGTNAGHCPLGE